MEMVAVFVIKTFVPPSQRGFHFKFGFDWPSGLEKMFESNVYIHVHGIGL